jgi:hypothetical protein
MKFPICYVKEASEAGLFELDLQFQQHNNQFLDIDLDLASDLSLKQRNHLLH